MADDIFRQGVSAAKTGDLDTACKYFGQFVKQNPQSENGWLALGACLSDVEKKEICFKKVLSLNPENEKARELLQGLKKNQVPIVEEKSPPVEPPIEKDGFKAAGLKFNPSLPLLIGFFVGLFVVGGLLIFIVNKNPPAIFDEFAMAIVPSPEDMDSGGQTTMTPTADGTSSGTWTPISTPSPSGSPFAATHSFSGSMNDRFRENYDKLRNATSLLGSGHFAEAIITLDEVIRILPEYSDAYFLRGLCYFRLTNNQRSLMDYIDNSQRAYDDLTKAIELGPPRGEYYFYRAQVLVNLSNQFEYRDDIAPFYQQSLDDFIRAYMLGSNYAWVTRQVGVLLGKTGRCEEALDFFLRLVDERGENATQNASINGGIADAYACLGEFKKALGYIEESISILEDEGEDTQEAKWRQVQILIALKRHNEAFKIIDEIIEERPHYNGWRYYERAYLYYLQGEPKLAYEDLDTGSGNTWLQYGMRAYVLALLALEEGDEDSGLYWLQIAEASLPKYSIPNIYEDTLEEIDQLGGSYLFPTATPSPTPAASPTPIPVVADEVYFTPTPVAGVYFSVLVNYSGTGITYFRSDEETVLLFRPEGYHDFSSIDSLTIKVTSEDFSSATQLASYFMLLDGSGFVGSISLYEGENEIPNPHKIVSDAGYFYVKIRNDYLNPIVVENISVQLVVTESDGTTAVYGYE